MLLPKWSHAETLITGIQCVYIPFFDCLTMMCVLLLTRYAWAAISEWQCQQGVTQQGMLGSEVVLSGPTPMRRSHSMSCMTQLQAKHSGTPFDQLEGTAG